jgi:hypothetical protein
MSSTYASKQPPPVKYFSGRNRRPSIRMFREDFPELNALPVRQIRAGKGKFIVSVAPDSLEATKVLFSNTSWVQVQSTSLVMDWDPE